VDSTKSTVRLALWPDEGFSPGVHANLKVVHTQYRAANVELDGRGLTLRNSTPPVKGRVTVITNV
jgi:hypothetical protein